MSFKNTLVILTSNIGSRTIAASSGAGGRLGAFMGRGGPGDGDDASRARLRRLVLEEVKEHFKPELLNRWGPALHGVGHVLGVPGREKRREAGRQGNSMRDGAGAATQPVCAWFSVST